MVFVLVLVLVGVHRGAEVPELPHRGAELLAVAPPRGGRGHTGDTPTHPAACAVSTPDGALEWCGGKGVGEREHGERGDGPGDGRRREWEKWFSKNGGGLEKERERERERERKKERKKEEKKRKRRETGMKMKGVF